MFNQQIHEEACTWFLRMRDGENDATASATLMEWLRQSPEHVSAYLDVAALWLEVKNLDTDTRLDLPTRIAQARADSAVAQMIFPRPLDTKVSRSRTARLVLAACTLIVTIGLSVAWWTYSRDTYSTDLGEQRSLSLPDGSTVALDSQSTVRVRFERDRRVVELRRGQALFHVAKDTSRPFLVRSGDTTVRAVGTQFNVYRKTGSTTVTVIEGTVAVEEGAADLTPSTSSQPEASAVMHPSPSDSVILVSAGEQATATLRSVRKAEHTNIATATAWTQRQLVFEFAPLADVADEFNRYNAKRLVIEGSKLRAHKVSALFRSTDPAALVRFVQSLPGVQVQETGDTIIVRSLE